jgi:hypothetical protein
LDLETLTGETEMSNKRVVIRMVLVMLLVGAFLLAVVPALAAPDSPQGIQNEAPGPRGRGNGGQGGGNYGSTGSQQNSYGSGTGTGFVDADGDGVCDNCTGTGFVDADGDGVCDNAGNLNAWSGSRAGGYGGQGRSR